MSPSDNQAAVLDELDAIELPASVQEALRQAEGPAEPGPSPSYQERLDAIAKVLVDKRKEAVIARQVSGIEDLWMQCEEAYLGIDDANRTEFAKARWAKPMVMEGPLQRESARDPDDLRSTAFVRLTSRYVNAGRAKVCEILIPPDGKSFGLRATPVPDLIKSKSDLRQIVKNGVPLERDAKPEELMSQALIPSPDGHLPGKPLTVKDLVEEQIGIADQKAKRAERHIFDWLVESRWRMQLRKVIGDAARLGVGVLKGPVPTRRRAMALTKVKNADGTDGLALQISSKLAPKVEWKDPWDVFPDPTCGEEIRNGDYCWDRDRLSRTQVVKLKQQDGYLADQIDLVLAEGPGKILLDGQNPNTPVDDKRFEVWYFYGALKPEELEAINGSEHVRKEIARLLAKHTAPKGQQEVYAVVTMINDRVIYATLQPLESGDLPLHSIPWERRSGCWAGEGVAEQGFVPQRIVNAATRALLNNGGVTSGPQIIVNRNLIEPADKVWKITPHKVWYTKANVVVEDVSKAFLSVNFTNVGQQLQAIIEYGMRMFEEVTSIPLITQGQSGPTTPQTFGAAQLQNNNANQLLRNIAENLDDYGIEPVVTQLYEWLLLDPDVPDEDKGDFQIDAHGSSALAETFIQNQELTQLMQAPAQNWQTFKVDPAKLFAEWLRGRRINPHTIQFSEEQIERMNQQPPPPPPQVMVEQIRAQVADKRMQLEKYLGELDAQIEQARAKADIDRDTVYVQAETERTRNQAMQKVEELRLKRELALLEYSNQRGITVDELKTELATTAMKLNVQRELAKMRVPGETTKPPIEPAGRAPNGQSFQR